MYKTEKRSYKQKKWKMAVIMKQIKNFGGEKYVLFKMRKRDERETTGKSKNGGIVNDKTYTE